MSPDHKKPVSASRPDQPTAAHVVKAEEEGYLEEVSPLHQLDPDNTAKYRIQVQFGKDRTIDGPNVCGITLWESGRKLHGGGDCLMYWCSEMDTIDNDTGKILKKGQSGCGGIIPDAFIGAASVENKHGGGGARQLLAQCPHCGGIIPSERLTGIKTYRMDTNKLAGVLAGLWRQPLGQGGLGGNADIYLKYHRTDMRYLACVDAHGADMARELKGLALYPLANILKDTMGGADLEHRIRAFLKA